jgi:hypothetical protein
MYILNNIYKMFYIQLIFNIPLNVPCDNVAVECIGYSHDRQNRPKQSGLNCLVEAIPNLRLI